VEIEVPAEIQSLAQKRWDAKLSKDFVGADAMRKEIESKGWNVVDGGDGWRVVKRD